VNINIFLLFDFNDTDSDLPIPKVYNYK